MVNTVRGRGAVVRPSGQATKVEKGGLLCRGGLCRERRPRTLEEVPTALRVLSARGRGSRYV